MPPKPSFKFLEIFVPTSHTAVVKIDIAKTRAAPHSEPAVKPRGFEPKQQDKVDGKRYGKQQRENSVDLPIITTSLSPMNPGALREMQIPIPIVTDVDPSTEDSSTETKTNIEAKMAPAAVVVAEQQQFTPDTVAARPWPYMLPEFLRPCPGTTFHDKRGGGGETTGGDIGRGEKGKEPLKKVGILQAALYGVPNPGKFVYDEQLVRADGVLFSILYGVKDEKEGEVVKKEVEGKKEGEMVEKKKD